MEPAEQIAARIAAAAPDLEDGSLRMFGELFGIPGRDHYAVRGARSTQNVVHIRFDGDLLSIWDPADVHVDAKGFRIGDASRVVWQWSEGLPHAMRYRIEYRKTGGTVETRSTYPDRPPADLNANAPAAELR